jgi:hypothetical protein
MLYRHDYDLNRFVPERMVYAQIVRRADSPPFQYYLMAADGEHIVLCHPITSDMNQNIARNLRSLTWNHISGNEGRSWCLQFQSDEDFQSVIEGVTIALWENGNQYSWVKAKV